MNADAETADNGHELTIIRIIDAPAAKLFRCWTEPELMKEWFTPRPWTTPVIETDPRAGGSSYIVMRGPEGQEFPNRGVYLEVVPNKKIVFTDAFTSAWQPSEKAFMVGIVEFEDLGDGKTRYTARARHWNAEDKKTHQEMGFEPGWNAATDQLEVLAKKI